MTKIKIELWNLIEDSVTNQLDLYYNLEIVRIQLHDPVADNIVSNIRGPIWISLALREETLL